MRLALDRSARLLAGGTVVLGGQPARLLRLTGPGARLLDAWGDGAAVGERPAAVDLAQRLIAAGLAHPVPAGEGPWTTADVAVVIPVRDRVDQLRACLARIGPAAEIVVVDDGSADGETVADAARTAGARVVRHAAPGGPSEARNTGVAATSAPLVAFLDSDTRPRTGWLGPLLGHLAEPGVAAVAPRVVVPAGRGPVSAYEAVRSPLDLGDAPGLVGPGRRIGFVPAAALLVRRDRLRAAGGFDPALRVGEDVDLVWRLMGEGWTVRYEPAAQVEHPHRAGVGAWLAQRVAYGASAGPLARRHPGRLHHAVVSRWALAPWLALAGGRPRAALASALAGIAVTAARLPAVPGERGALVRFAAGAQLRGAGQLLDALWRAYPPVVLAAAARSPRLRRLAATGLTVSIAADWVSRRPRLDPLRYGALRTADDLAYAYGLWLGCARARTLDPLVPRVL